MTSAVKRPSFFNSLLGVLLVLSILGFVLSAIGMFFAGDAHGVCVSGSVAIFCLLNSVGITLIMRWHKGGVLLCLLTALAECYSLTRWQISLSWLPKSSVYYKYFPFAVVGCFFLIVTVPLFILKAQPSGKRIWSEMKSGMDLRHSRHIFQLTTILTIGVTIAMVFYKPSETELYDPKQDKVEMEDKTLPPASPASPPAVNKAAEPHPVNKTEDPHPVNYTLLDSPRVTWDEILYIESILDSLPAEDRQIYRKRIFALKHVFMSGLRDRPNKAEKLRNAFLVHEGEFSDQQQRIVDWYLALSPEEQSLWFRYSPGARNMYDFKLKLTSMIKKHQKEFRSRKENEEDSISY